MEELVEEYISYLRVEKGSSPLTIQAYSHDLKLYCAFLQDPQQGFERAPLTSVESIDREAIVAFEAYLLQTKSYAVSSVSRSLAALKSFHSFLLREGYCETDPTQTIPMPQKVQNLPDVLSVEQVCSMLDSMDGSKPLELRDRAMMELLYGCGLRVSELCGLDCDRIDLSEGFILVMGKGRKERAVPLSGTAAESLSVYLEQGRPSLAKQASKALFLNARGGRLSRQSVFKLVQREGLKIGVKNLHPHSLRHSCATHMLDGGADLRLIQDMLGHSDISTTQIYTHVQRSHIREEYVHAHPRAKRS